MGGQLDGNFLPSSLSHKFILIVTLLICFVVNKFFSLSLEWTRPTGPIGWLSLCMSHSSVFSCGNLDPI